MLTYKTGDLFEEKTEAIVNAVNCVGVMGRGIALQFKKRFPKNFEAYKDACARKEVLPGQMFIHELDTPSDSKYIINFPTKRHWRSRSRIEDIDLGLQNLVQTIQKLPIKSIAIPPLGCGLGGLNWDDVRKLVELHLGQLQTVEVIVFEPIACS